MSVNFASVIYNGYSSKKEFRNKNIRLQSVKNIINKRLSLAVKESIKIENNTLIYDSINYTGLLGLFRDNYWYSLFSYDKNTSKEDILYIKNVSLSQFNEELRHIENININDLYLKFNNKKQYYKIECFNCMDGNNTIKLEAPNKDINQSSYFSLIKSSYSIKLEDKTLYLYHSFKQWLQEPYKNKSILIDGVKSFKIRKVSNHIIINICLDNNLCADVYTIGTLER